MKTKIIFFSLEIKRTVGFLLISIIKCMTPLPAPLTEEKFKSIRIHTLSLHNFPPIFVVSTKLLSVEFGGIFYLAILN